MIDVATDSWIYFCGTDETETTTKCYWELYIDVILIAASVSINNVLIVASQPNANDNDDSDDSSSSLLLHGFIQFSLLYFSIMNSWYLYSHHYTSRFVGETSKIQSVLVACYVVGMILSVIYCNDNGGSSIYDNNNDEDYIMYYMKHVVQGFSISMIITRVSIFVMVARVAIHIPQVSPLCAFLGFFIGDSILCYTLSAADTQAAPFLWGFVVIMELHIDFFLLVLNGNTTTTTTYSDRDYDDNDYYYNGQSQQHRRHHRLRRSSSLSYDLKLTMDRSWILILAPLGSLMVTVATNPDCRDCSNKVLICSSITLLVLFAFLYFDLQYAALYEQQQQVTSSQRGGSELCRALLLTVIKFLGWSLWTVGACLVILIIRDGRHHRHQRDRTGNPGGDNGDDNDYDYYDEDGGYGYGDDESGNNSIIGVHLLLGWSVGGSLILFLALKLFGQRSRPNGLVQVLWVLACWTPFLVVCFVPSSRTSTTALSIYLILVSSLNIVEAWINLSNTTIEEEERRNGSSESPQQTNNNDERQRLITTSTTTNDSIATYTSP